MAVFDSVVPDPNIHIAALGLNTIVITICYVVIIYIAISIKRAGIAKVPKSAYAIFDIASTSNDLIVANDMTAPLIRVFITDMDTHGGIESRDANATGDKISPYDQVRCSPVIHRYAGISINDLAKLQVKSDPCMAPAVSSQILIRPS